MASKGKRGGGKYRVRTRTIVKYRTRAVKVARRARKHGAGLAKERGVTTLIGLADGYIDGKRAQGEYQMLSKIPKLPGGDWELTVGAGLHFYHASNRGARWADQGATSLLAIGAYKFGRSQAGAAIAGSGEYPDAMSGWMNPNG